MMKIWGKNAMLAVLGGVLGGVLSGCVAQMQNFNVTHTVTSDQALAVLKDVEASFNAPAHAVGAPYCEYTQTGMAGSAVQFLLIGSTAQRHGSVAYQQWRVSEIRKGQGLAGEFYTIFVTSSDGATCAPLRSAAGTPEALVIPKIEETLTALVSLGVAYDPNRLGSAR
ncbi:MAG TPA: hypothetical protein VIN57_05510 [Magnetovibrio sp.]